MSARKQDESVNWWGPGKGEYAQNGSSLVEFIIFLFAFPIMVVGAVGYGLFQGLKWLWPIVKPSLISLLQLLAYLVLSGVHRLGKLIKPKRREVILMDPEIVSDNQDQIEQLLAEELHEISGDWSLPDLPEGYSRSQLAQVQEVGVLETVLASLKGRFKAKVLMKYRDTIINMLEQKRLLVRKDIEEHRALFDRILLKEDLSYELEERSLEHRLNITKKRYQLEKTRQEIKELVQETEPEEVEVVDEEQQIYDRVKREVNRKAKQEIFRQELRSEKVEEALQHMRKRIEEIELNPELTEEDKRRLKEELQEETEYMIKRIYEKGES